MRTLPFCGITAIAALTFGFLLSGCVSDPAARDAAAAGPGGVHVAKNSSLFGFLKPYRTDVQQGNFVSREMVAQLKPGMTRDQVRFVLGTPLMTDIFHTDRWDYDFRLTKGNGEWMSSRVSVFFSDDRLDRYEGGNDLPTEQEYLSLITGSRKHAMPELSDAPIVPTITNR
ncbi:MAG: outer membrane protein assembly factor BamE [Herbaspirillum sp.]